MSMEIIKQSWTKIDMELILKIKMTDEQWNEVVDRLDRGSFYDELSYIASDFIKEELELMKEENNERN